MSLLNKKAVRVFALAATEEMRPHLRGKFTRVSAEFIETSETALRLWIKHRIENMPTTGRTIR